MFLRPLVIAVAATALAAGCGSGQGTTAAPPAPVSPAVDTGQFNATDVMFVQMMVAHNSPATEMLRLIQERTYNDELKTLAAAVRVTQADEVNNMLAWLKNWDQPITAPTHAAAHAEHGGMPATGEAEIAAIRNASADGIDKIFLNLFIGHQHQAVEFARMELAGGVSPVAVQLAHRVDQSRRAQIELMLKMVA